MNKTISIIIITYNRPDDLLILLKDISKLSHLELLSNAVVLNNQSTEDYSQVEEYISKNTNIPFLYEISPSNKGVAAGRNYATSLALGDIFLYLDDDIELPDINTLPKILKAFSPHQRTGRPIGIVSFKVLYADDMNIQKTAFAHKNYNKFKDCHRFITSYYTGCAHAKTRQAWQAAGPYPEDFFYGMEEYDFSYRVIDQGYCILFNDILTVVHKESPKGRKPKSEKLLMMWVNKGKVAWRYLPFRYFITTSLFWSMYFLIKSGFDFRLWFLGCLEMLKIPKQHKKTILSAGSLSYLRSVKARLLY